MKRMTCKKVLIYCFPISLRDALIFVCAIPTFLKSIILWKTDIYTITFLSCKIILKNFRIFYMEQRNYSSTSLKDIIEMPKRDILVKIMLILKKNKFIWKPFKQQSLKKSFNAPKRNGSLKGSIKASLLVITCIFLLFFLSIKMHFYCIILHFKYSCYFRKNLRIFSEVAFEVHLNFSRSLWISKEMNTSSVLISRGIPILLLWILYPFFFREWY